MCTFFQICQSVDVDDQLMETWKKLNRLPDLNVYLNGSDAIKDMNPEFFEDLQTIQEKFPNNIYVTKFILGMVSDDFDITIQ